MTQSAFTTFLPFAWRFIKRRPWAYVCGIVAVVLVDGVQMLPPLIIRRITNEAQQDPKLVNITQYAFWLVGCYLAISFLRMAWRFSLMIPSRAVERELRQESFDRLLQSDYAQASRLKVGDVVSTLSQDIANIRTFMGPGILVFFDTLAYLTFVPITLFWIVGPNAFWVLLPFSALLIAVWTVHGPLETGHEAVSNRLGDLSQYVYEEAQGAKFFRAEGLIELRRHKYDLLVQGLFKRQLGNAKWELGLDGTLQLVIQASYLVVLGLAARGRTEAATNLGTVAVSLQLLDKLIWPLWATSYLMELYQSAAAGAKRLTPVDSLPLKAQGARELARPLESVRLEGLSLQSAQGTALLHEIDLVLRPGMRVALVGEVGSGKSVLLQTLAGLWEPGSIRARHFAYGDVPFSELDRHSLWRQLSYIPQTPQIFGRSLAQNISPHLPLVESHLQSALDAADLAQDVALFPEGLRTSIGEKGLNLSGGQKQRTLIARSFHSGASLYLWDDAISALDPQTERKVIQNLHRLSPQAILLLATHRLSALSEFDLILVLEQGRVVRRGTLREIKRDHSLFSTLVRIEQEALSKT